MWLYGIDKCLCGFLETKHLGTQYEGSKLGNFCAKYGTINNKWKYIKDEIFAYVLGRG